VPGRFSVTASHLVGDFSTPPEDTATSTVRHPEPRRSDRVPLSHARRSAGRRAIRTFPAPTGDLGLPRCGAYEYGDATIGQRRRNDVGYGELVVFTSKATVARDILRRTGGSYDTCLLWWWWQ